MKLPTLVLTAAAFTLLLSFPAPAQDEAPPAEEFKITSELLTAFWGREMTIEAGVVLPPAHDPSSKYLVCYNIHGFGGSHRGAWRRAARLREGMLDGTTPVMIYVYLNAQFPMGHHEFADSVNNGPWGKALIEEFIPALEKRFGGFGEPGARFLTGHSSGGWSSLWLQVTYPEFFGGTWSTAPDSADFRDFTGIDIYDDENAYFDEDGNERPLVRRGTQEVMSFRAYAMREAERRPLGGQMYSFDAVFSPRAVDGTPMKLFDRETGVIDKEVAEAWKKYDIGLILREQWATLGPKLKGKIRVWCGTLDTFHLDGAARLLQWDLAQLGSDAEILLVEGRDHGDIFRPHPDLWPRGMMHRIHWDMAKAGERFFPQPHSGEL